MLFISVIVSLHYIFITTYAW